MHGAYHLISTLRPAFVAPCHLVAAESKERASQAEIFPPPPGECPPPPPPSPRRGQGAAPRGPKFPPPPMRLANFLAFHNTACCAHGRIRSLASAAAVLADVHRRTANRPTSVSP